MMKLPVTLIALPVEITGERTLRRVVLHLQVAGMKSYSWTGFTSTDPIEIKVTDCGILVTVLMLMRVVQVNVQENLSLSHVQTLYIHSRSLWYAG
jgi:hypothetical protein